MRSAAAYYTEAVTEALLHMGINLTAEQISELEETIEISVSNESLAFGHDCIPNPLESEVRRVERLRQDDAKDADKRLSAAESEANDTIGRLRSRIRDLERELADARRAA